jgi:HK97 family phage major capsid protein/HK97 family phage prohead protease
MRLKQPPKDGLVRALPSLTLRAAEAEPDDAASESPVEAAAEAGQMPILTGHFLRFDQWTEINSYYEGNFLESIAPGAIKKTLAQDGDDIRCLFQHGMDWVVGDKPLGPFDELIEDDEGGYYEVPLLDTSYNRDLVPGLAASLYGASFCFRVIREDFNEEPEPSDYNPKGMPERVLREIQVIELGPVTFPAYDGASAELEGASKGMRSMTDDLLAMRFGRDPEGLDVALEQAEDPSGFAELLSDRGVRSAPRILAASTRSAKDALEAHTEALEEASEALSEFAELADEATAGTEEHPGTGTATNAETGEETAAGEALPPAEDAEGEPAAGAAAEEPAEQPEATEEGEPSQTEADTADDPAAEGTEPEGEEQDQDRSTSPEGNDPEGHRAGRREKSKPKQASRAAADKKKGIPMTLEELRARKVEIESRMQAINEEHGDAELPEEAQTEYDGLETERSENARSIERIEARKAEVRQFAKKGENREAGDGSGAHFNTSGEHESNPYDLEAVMTRARGAVSVEQRGTIMRDAALRAIDQEEGFFAGTVQTDGAKRYLDTLLRREAQVEGAYRSEIAERILATGSEMYARAFAKVVQGSALQPEEQRALATFTNASGGFAVPYVLDPTIIPTSNYSVNPFRAIARKETIVGSNEWKGVTSGAVTVAYAAEGAEASDNSPTLAQPTANPERCQAFIPLSYEVESDWPAVLAEMATLISEGKDDTEATKFTLGAGHGSKEPEGLLTGATEVVATKTAKTYVIADLYHLEEELAARFRPRAKFVGSRFTYNATRQFDTAGGAGLWLALNEAGIGNNVPRDGSLRPTLAGYPAYECSAYASGLTTTNKILTIGDFRYFLIVDRVGMNIELIPNLFGGSGRPTGQRGIYAFWRNTSKVLSKAAFKTLEVA